SSPRRSSAAPPRFLLGQRLGSLRIEAERAPLVSVMRLDYHRGLAPVLPLTGPRRSSMSAWLRAGLFAALFVFATTPSPAADKTFQDDALDDAAITLEADLKDKAGTVEKPLAKLKQEAEALLKRQDLDSAADAYVQIVTFAPNDVAAWRRLADIWLLMPVTE